MTARPAPEKPAVPLPEKIRGLLGPFLRRRSFAAGEALWREGDEAGLFVSLVAGRVKVFRGSGRREVTVYLFGPGDSFGFMPFLDGRPYPASARALTPVDAWVMTRAELKDAFARDPQVALALVELLATRLREALLRIERSASPEVLPRVAAALLALVPEPPPAPLVLKLPVNARDLAASLDVVPESFSRAVTALVRRRVLHRLGPRSFQVLDLEGLTTAAVDPNRC